MDELDRPQARGEQERPLSHHFSTIRHVFYRTPTVHYPYTSCILHVPIGARLPNSFEDRNQQPPPPLIVDGQPGYLIERIKDSKYNRVRCKCQLQYHIKWVDCPISNDPSNWILADAFDDPAGQLTTTAYRAQHANQPSLEKLAKGWGR